MGNKVAIPTANCDITTFDAKNRNWVEEYNKPALLRKAMGAPGHGLMFGGAVYKVMTTGVKVYRLHNHTSIDNPSPQQGRWWSFSMPKDITYEQYRREYGICPAWNTFERMSSAELRRGALIVVGCGQSVYCDGKKAGETYAQSNKQQVFIENPKDDLFKFNTVKSRTKMVWDKRPK